MNELLKVLNENRSGYLATTENGKPRVRPFEFQFEEGGKYYFCTNSTKNVYKQLADNPFVEFSATSKDLKVVRINGEIIFSDDMNIKERIISTNKLVGSTYKTADNPIFTIFYLEHGSASLLSLLEKTLKKFDF